MFNQPPRLPPSMLLYGCSLYITFVSTSVLRRAGGRPLSVRRVYRWRRVCGRASLPLSYPYMPTRGRRSTFILHHLALPYTHLQSRTYTPVSLHLPPPRICVCLLRRTRLWPRLVVIPPRRRFSLYLHTDRRIAREDRLRIISLLVLGMCEKGITKLSMNIRWR